MNVKIFFLLSALCLLNILSVTKGAFIKGKNVPRVGRSNEFDGLYDKNSMDYVIKTIPSKNIPRMGRRNYDSENRYDIPKFHELPAENFEYGDEAASGSSPGQIAAYYGTMENMKK